MTKRRSRTLAGSILSTLLVVALVMTAMPAGAQQPRYGGELVFPVPSEPPSYDGHREETFGLIHPFAPFYSTLLRVDPTDPSGTKPVGDLAESWTVSKDGLTYTFKLRHGRQVPRRDRDDVGGRQGVLRQDRLPAGRRRLEPQGPVPPWARWRRWRRRIPYTVRFQLKWPESSFLLALSSPYNFIYKADILAKDMHWYEKNVMGTGPFKFVEHVKGSHVVGKKNPDYWDKGKPYLDGFRAVFVSLLVGAGGDDPRRARPHPVPRLQPGRARQPRPGAREQDHGPGEPLGLHPDGRHQPREEALRRQARPPGAHARARPLRGLEGAVADRHRARTSPASRSRARRTPRRPPSWRSSPATAATSTRRAPRRGGSSRRPAPRGSRSPSRTAASPCPTSRSPSG